MRQRLPLALTIILPSILVFVIVKVPDSASDFQKLLDMLPAAVQTADQEKMMLNKIMPAFFLMIPIMASSVMAASSFVGMMVSFLSFAAMILVLETELLFLTGTMIMPDLNWIIIMLLVAPSASLVAISITVRGSVKAQTMEEAQQYAVFLIFPILALVIGQFAGMILISTWLLLGMGIVLALIAALLMNGSVGKL